MKKVLAFICVLILIVVIAYATLARSGYLQAGTEIAPKVAATAAAVAATTPAPVVEKPAPPLTKNYTNKTLRFSVSMPADFSAQVLPADDSGVTTIALQNPKGDGIQILVTGAQGTTKTLSADDVRAALPDMKITDAQEVDIGDDYKGVAFKSDNAAFANNSREVWFIFRGNLYQISTYARLDPLLQSMFATWKFL